jgi:lysozyme family protein
MYVLTNEGTGFTDDPRDHGGATKFGITQAELSKWRRTPVSKDDVRNLTEKEALEIFEAYYWNPMGCDKMTDANIATAIFDTGVNLGPVTAVRMAQIALKIPSDGHAGDQTIQALNKADRLNWLYAFISEIQKHYIDICKTDETQIRFLSGWLERSRRLITLI